MSEVSRPQTPLVWSGENQVPLANGGPFIQFVFDNPSSIASLQPEQRTAAVAASIGLCCGTRQVYFGNWGTSGVLSILGQEGPVTDDHWGYPQPFQRVEISLEEWIRADIEWWNTSHANTIRPTIYIYIGVITDLQKKAFGHILEEHGWVFGTTHINGRTGRLLHIVSWSKNNGNKQHSS